MDPNDQREPYWEDTGGKTAPAKPRRQKSPKVPPPRQLPPWKVMLHNDDVNEIGDVVNIIYQLTPLTKEEAIERVLETHNTGASLLLVTHQERAELYVEQFTSYKLTVTAEADS